MWVTLYFISIRVLHACLSCFECVKECKPVEILHWHCLLRFSLDGIDLMFRSVGLLFKLSGWAFQKLIDFIPSLFRNSASSASSRYRWLGRTLAFCSSYVLSVAITRNCCRSYFLRKVFGQQSSIWLSVTAFSCSKVFGPWIRLEKVFSLL